MIIKNQILCLLCDTLCISKHGHDMCMCECNSIGADGGTNYLRRIGESYNYLEMSIMDTGEHSLRREHVMWGVNYDQNHNRLPSTIFKPIKDLNEGHLQAILDTQTQISNFYREVFKDELKYRKKNKL